MRELLKNKNLTQSYVAQKLNISQQLVSGWVTGKCRPPLNLVAKLAKLLEVSIETILNCFA